MYTTGIVRRIDDLGRVVIPKEIRKTLRIKEGDPLEIYANKEELIFKKFSPMASVSKHAELVSWELSSILDCGCMILDCDEIISISGSKNKDIIGAIMSDEMASLVNKRKVFNLSRDGEKKPVKIHRGDETEYENQLVFPIISNGDCLGVIVLVTQSKEKRFGLDEEKLVRLGASFLSAQFDF